MTTPDSTWIDDPLPTATATRVGLDEAVHALLDRALALGRNGDALGAFRLLQAPLSALWSQARGTAQADAMRQWCRAHPLHALVQQDPFTNRAATKPRGYAGDAVMLDYVYDSRPPEGTSDIGHAVFTATTRSGMGLSVCHRRALLRGLIDETVGTVAGARLLSVACGHARELQGSLVDSELFDGEFVALDQDPLSCAEVQRSMAGRRVRVLQRGVRELMTAEGGAGPTPPLAAELGRFDLIYSAGLYDYLPDVAAQRLARRLLQMLRPGGRLLIGNFVPAGSGRAYQELFMDWTLVLRNEVRMRELGQAVAAAQVATWLDPHRNVAYAELRNEP